MWFRLGTRRNGPRAVERVSTDVHVVDVVLFTTLRLDGGVADARVAGVYDFPTADGVEAVVSGDEPPLGDVRLVVTKITRHGVVDWCESASVGTTPLAS